MTERAFEPADEIVFIELTDELVQDSELIGRWPAKSPNNDVISVKVGPNLLIMGTPAQHREFIGCYGLQVAAAEESLLADRVAEGRIAPAPPFEIGGLGL